MLKQFLPKIKDLFSKIEPDDEIEIMFNNFREDNELKAEDFIRTGKYLKKLSLENKQDLQKNIMLDVIYSIKPVDKNTLENIRININGLTNINNVLNLVHQRTNNVIFIMLSSMNEDYITIDKKQKNKKYIIDFDEFNIRFRKSKELKLSSKEKQTITNLSSTDSDKIIFRFKQRLSYIKKTSFGEIIIDLTDVRTSDNINKIRSSQSRYELELELEINTKEKNLNEKQLEELINEIIKIKQVLTQNKIIELTLSPDEIIKHYKKLVYNNENDTSTSLYSMQPITAQVQNIVDQIPNKYSVTDKADGEKFCIFIIKNKCYLIDNNLNIRPTDITVNNLDNTIIEGEFIFLQDKQVFLMMVYDCLYLNGKEIKSNNMLVDRIDSVYKFLDNMKIDYYKYKPYEDKYNLSKMRTHYEKEITNFYDKLNDKIVKSKNGDVIFFPKFFLFPETGEFSEIFMYSDLIWEACTENILVKCPYELDGVIYTPLDQKYTAIKKDQRLPIFKYKPPHLNSIDVYLVFPRNEETGGYLEIYDNTEQNNVKGTVYRVANFYVGSISGNKEVPIPFMRDENNFIAYFPIINNQVRDIQKDIVNDKTVVEIIYNNNPEIPHQYRWNILRTRWDKTQSVRKFNKKYGNFNTVAVNTWMSMREAVTFNEIKILSEPDSYEKQMNILKLRIDNTIITTNRQQDAYYQKTSNLVRPMREFHNFIKSVLIYNYCSPKRFNRNTNTTKLTVLDIGGGRGGDILKFYHPRVSNYVGIEVDFENINAPFPNGAIARYNKFKQRYPYFPKMTFIHADAGLPLKGDIQKRSLGNMKLENKELIDKTFSKKEQFDVLSCQFAVHYLFEDDKKLDNFCNNINDNLKKGGYFIFTLFDGDKLLKLLSDKLTFTSYYTDEEGKREKLFEIIRKFPIEEKEFNKTGLSVDVLMTWINDNHLTEYLVTPSYLIKTMKKKCNAVLIESDGFDNFHKLNKPWFENVIHTENNPENKKFYERTSVFFKPLTGADKESKIYSFWKARFKGVSKHNYILS